MTCRFDVLGIDPALRKGGLGVCLIKDSKVYFYTYTVPELLAEIFKGTYKNMVVAVENSNLQNTSFDTSGVLKVALRKARNAGANQGVSQVICDCLKGRCQTLHELSPQQKGAKKPQAFVEALARSEGLEFIYKPSNQDRRDAFMLAFIIFKRLK